MQYMIRMKWMNQQVMTTYARGSVECLSILSVKINTPFKLHTLQLVLSDSKVHMP